MTKVVNLRQARKQRSRAARRAKGDENAAAHGRSAEERSLSAKRETQRTERLEGHLRERGAQKDP